MIKNYFKIAWRNLLASKGYSAINIIGLSVGLAVCLMILLYIFDETSYDKHHNDAAQLYRINTSFKSKVDQSKIASANALVAHGLLTDFPEVEQSARLLLPNTNNGAVMLEYTEGANRKSFFEKNTYYVDSSFFDLFTYRFLQGDPRTALSQPNTAVLSETMAHRFFGNADPMGKTIRVGLAGGYFDYTVKGVFQPLGPSHIDGHVFLSMKNGDMGRNVDNITNWATFNAFLTYIRLKKGTDPVAFEKRLTPFLHRHGNADIEAAGAERMLSMQPVKDIHLYSSLPYDISINSSISYLYILGSIALFILLIACVNFMNLATARSQKRAKEVGMRKVMGALRGSLVAQFLGESILLSAAALLLALFLVQSFLPAFNTLTQRQLTLFQHPVIVGWIIGLALLTGLLAGLYPAFYLSSFRPIRVLKGQLVNSLSALFLRKGLVVFQFSISVFLILTSLVIWQQMGFLNRQDLGFQKDQQLVIPLRTAQAAANFTALKETLAKNAKVISVAGGTTYPGMDPFNDLRFYKDGQSVADGVGIAFGRVGYDYLQTLGMKMIAGHAFSKEFASDSAGIIFNETAIRKLGLDPRTAVGTVIHSSWNKVVSNTPIVGIVKDFNFKNLKESINPYGFVLDNNDHRYLFAHVNTADYGSLLSDLATAWQRLNPSTPFEYSFVDQDFQRTYEREYRIARIIGVFTGLTIFIACLGLFGLAAFTAEQRIREIGIRKVLGSSVSGIATLLSKDFIRLVLLSLVIASPLAWWAMHRWLQDFAYRTPIHWWLFVMAGILAVGIALLTVSFQAIKAALANPIKSLRSE
ncbi:MAG TPA: ABC transporter permease [Puia sp.]|jgi:putative ABC transport system permease protein